LQTWLVTGGAGFIGTNFVLAARRAQRARIINLDLLSYAGNTENLKSLADDRDYQLIQGDIGDPELVKTIIKEHRPSAVINFAAESHVDRSITDPLSFIKTNVNGTCNLLEQAYQHWRTTEGESRGRFRFLHISTDEVYGSLGPNDPGFTEKTQYQPNSPYSASKASSDHFTRAYFHTYGFPALTSNCSNNYGPFQFPEKLIPLVIGKCLAAEPIPVYGDGKNVRDWLYVEDHVHGLLDILERGQPGQTYNIGGNNELTNLEVVHGIAGILDEMRPRGSNRIYQDLITYVTDRPGHDRRYAIDASKIKNELGWTPSEKFASGIRKTIAWYLENQAWVDHIKQRSYQGERLGLRTAP